MKDSFWIYIKDSILAPVLFVVDFTFTPLYNTKKQQNKIQKQKIKNKI